MMKHHDQRNLGRKGFVWLVFPHHCSPLKEVRAGTQAGLAAGTQAGLEAGAMQWPRTGAAYWLALHGLLSLLFFHFRFQLRSHLQVENSEILPARLESVSDYFVSLCVSSVIF